MSSINHSRDGGGDSADLQPCHRTTEFKSQAQSITRKYLDETRNDGTTTNSSTSMGDNPFSDPDAPIDIKNL